MEEPHYEYTQKICYPKGNLLCFRHFRQFSTVLFVIYSIVPSNLHQNCYQIENFRVCGIMEPVFYYPQPLFPSTRAPFRPPEWHLSPTGRNRLNWRPYDPLPIFTIFHPNMRHSFSLFMIDLQAGLRYNISINQAIPHP